MSGTWTPAREKMWEETKSRVAQLFADHFLRLTRDWNTTSIGYKHLMKASTWALGDNKLDVWISKPSGGDGFEWKPFESLDHAWLILEMCKDMRYACSYNLWGWIWHSYPAEVCLQICEVGMVVLENQGLQEAGELRDRMKDLRAVGFLPIEPEELKEDDDDEDTG